MRAAAGAAGLALLLASCGGGAQGCAPDRLPVRVAGKAGAHVFCVEQARTSAEQERGLMFRRTVEKDGGMLFWPYPPDGGPPREAIFWMKDTPAALDILYIRADGTIARVAPQAVPFSQTPIGSGEPVAAVLELRGGRAGALGIAAGDRVTWPGHPPEQGRPG